MRILVIVILWAATVLWTGCQQDEDSRLLELNTDLHRFASLTMDVSDAGARALAWVTLAEDLEHGRLFVQVQDQSPVEIEDTQATPVLDAETPPQITYGPDDHIYVSYSAAVDLEDKWSSMAIRLVQSGDGGKTWSAPVSVGAGEPYGGYRNDHEMVVGRDGVLYVAWLDSRFHEEGKEGEIHVVISRSSDGGATWSAPVLVDQDASCECCRVVLATNEAGHVLLAWRKILPGGIRDIVVARSVDGANTWSKPNRVFADDWEMGYCPDAGPSMVMDPSGILHLAWWTGKEGAAGVKYIQSKDGGDTFGDPVEMKTSPLSKASHVQLAVEDERVAVTWDDGALETSRIAIRVSQDRGATFDELRYLSPDSRAAAYPVIAFQGDVLLTAWHIRGAEAHMTRLHKTDQNAWVNFVDDPGPKLVINQQSR